MLKVAFFAGHLLAILHCLCSHFLMMFPIALTSNASPVAVDLSKYVLVHQDDFNAHILDTSVWDYRQLNNKRNNIVSYDSLTKTNVSLSNGLLYLFVDHVSGNLFSAPMISTEKHPAFYLKYGYVEIRAQLPGNYGSYAAFWLQSPRVGKENNNPSINGVEVDIFEYGKASGIDDLYHSLVWNGYGNNKKEISVKVNVPGISRGFHVFGLEWTPREYIVYVDGKINARSSDGISHTAEFIILSMGTGGYGGNPLGQGNQFPNIFNIDYIRMYAIKPMVHLYSKCDYYELISSDLAPGSYKKEQLETMKISDQPVSSIEVPQGWSVTLYDRDNFEGNSMTIKSDHSCLSKWGKPVKSLKISSISSRN